jgi:hypothetical protein
MKFRCSITTLALLSLSCELRTPDEVVRAPSQAPLTPEDGGSDYVPPPGDGDGDGDMSKDAGHTPGGDGEGGTPVMGLDGGIDPVPDPKFSKGELLAAVAQCTIEHYQELDAQLK